ncbi:MAG: hypothetical protein COA79_13925, partial [Planctomycetota bacterium]
MIKKSLNPLLVGAFLFVMALGVIGHLMYGDCQASKYHYIMQSHLMGPYLPKWLLIKKRHVNGEVAVYKNYTGVWKTWFVEGTIQSKTNFLNSKINGMFSNFYSNGKMQFKIHYKNRMAHGSYKSWHENGQIKSTGNMIKGKGVGAFLSWHENGVKRREVLYVNGETHGKEIIWYDNGAPSKAWCFLLGVSPDLEILPSSEELIRASHS